MKLPARRRVAVIGLDALPAELLFKRWRVWLPHLDGLMQQGVWGVLRSCDPPITVPAWAAMLSGKDPGELGIYGFRNRASYAYDDAAIAHSGLLPHERVWDMAGRAGKSSLVLGVPLTYPPPRINGWLVSCFLTPSQARTYTAPAELRHEVEAALPDYEFDVADFRTSNKGDLAQRIHAKTAQHFELARRLVRNKPWDFFMMVEMGPDRMQHAFWSATPEPQGELFDYYRALDAQVGALLAELGDEVTVLVVSDHGAQSMTGGVNLNEWLMARGYLHLHQPPTQTTPLSAAMVDWSRTRAWGEGGYVGRIHLNVAGREPQGIVAAGDYEALRDELINELSSGLPAQDAAPSGSAPAASRAAQSIIAAEAWRPQERYRECRGIAPDLMVYFGDLRWRALGSVGSGRLSTSHNDRGPDGANHHPDGVFILRSAQGNATGQIEAHQLMDVAPTILHELGLTTPPGVRGRVIAAPTPHHEVHYSQASL